MSKRIALVLCQTSDSDSQRIWTPPLTTPLLAEILQARGWIVSLFDSRLLINPNNTNEQNVSNLANAVLEALPDVVGFSFLSPNAQFSEQVAFAICNQNPKLPIIAGGAHCSSAPYLYTRPYNVIVRGEADDIIVEIADKLIKDGMPNRQLIIQSPVPNLQDSPIVVGANWFPYNDIYEGAEYRTGYVQLGRGCPFSCSFCNSSNGQRTRARPTEVILKEVELLKDKFGVKYIGFIDSIATSVPFFDTTFESISDIFAGNTISLNSTFVRFTELVAQVVADFNGDVTIWFGLETGSERIGRQELKGKWNKQATFKAINLCKKYGIKIGLNCIFGFADENDDDRRQTIELLRELQPDYPNPNILNPIPGTLIYNRYLQTGLLRDPLDLSIWDAKRIRETGEGPINDLDYQKVYDAYEEVENLKNN
ncbi:MAG: radical SAM protein [Candidatus Peregrinibacteria bacterium GW2011_GWF2_33_10]